MFNFLKNKKNDTTKLSVDTKQGHENSLQLLNLRKDMVLDLTKNIEVLNNRTANVALILDYSGSMRDLYMDGTVQKTIEKIVPIALNLDNDKTLDVWSFESSFRRLPLITSESFENYVENEMLKFSFGGTRYSPVMNDIAKKYLYEEKVSDATYVIFITDGDCTDKPATEKLIRELSDKPIFWQFVGIGNANMDFLEKLDDIKDREVDNADFFRIQNISQISDETLYQKLFDEFPTWLKIVKEKNLIK